MSKWSKPKAGSRGYWPRKRAKRIYPTVKTDRLKSDKVGPTAFAGYKAGMTRVSFNSERKGSAFYGQEVVKAATVLECPPLVIAGIKTYRKTPYGLEDSGLVLAEKLSKDLVRKTSVPKNATTKDKLAAIEKDVEKLADVRLLVHTQPKDTGLGKKRPELFELGLSGDVKAKWAYAKDKLGSQLKPEDIFKEGETVDVQA